MVEEVIWGINSQILFKWEPPKSQNENSLFRNKWNCVELRGDISLCYSKCGLSLFLCPHNRHEILSPSNASPWFFSALFKPIRNSEENGIYCTWVERNYVNIWSHFMCCSNIALVHDGENVTFVFLFSEK